MPALLLYLLKVNVALLLFFLAYHLVLRRLTFYHLNRRFLLFGILFSTLYPFIDITPFLNKPAQLPIPAIAPTVVWVTASQAPTTAPAFDFWQLPVWLFWLGAGVMAIRLVLQFVSLYRIHAASEPDSHNGIGFRKVQRLTQTFSFWQNIYLNPSQHKQEELESILRHEQVHVQGWHTLDVLLAEISTVFYWFNPGMWLMKKAIKENLEFIADQQAIRAGADKKEYQYLLLKVTGVPEPHIATQFSFPSLKRRIAMINKLPTNKANRLRLLVVLPIVAVLLLAFRSVSEPNTEPVQQAVQAVETTAAALPAPQQEELALSEALQQDDPVYVPDAANQTADYKDFLKRNPQVKQAGWKGSKKTVLVVFLNSGATELYNLLDEKSRAAAENKYGKLPVLPPPPPPAAPPTPPAPPVPPAPAAPEVPKEQVRTSRFPGGEKSLYEYLGRNIKYPRAAIKANAHGEAVVEFTVEKDGSITNPKVIQAPHESIKQEVLRIVGSMPKWLPAEANEQQPVFTQKMLIKFTIKEESKRGTGLSESPQPATAPGVIPVTVVAFKSSGSAPAAPVPAQEVKASSIDDNIIIHIIKPFINYDDNQIESIKAKFMKHGFNLEFDDIYSQGEIATLKVALTATKSKSRASATYNMHELRGKRHEIILSGNKETGEVRVFSQPVIKKNPTNGPVTFDAIDGSKVTATVVERSHSRSRSASNIAHQLLNYIKYPEDAKENNIHGESKLVFTLEKDGSISNLEVLSAPHEIIKQELIRAINALPKFLPAGADDSQQVETFKFVITHNLGFRNGQVVKSSMGIHREY